MRPKASACHGELGQARRFGWALITIDSDSWGNFKMMQQSPSSPEDAKAKFPLHSVAAVVQAVLRFFGSSARVSLDWYGQSAVIRADEWHTTEDEGVHFADDINFDHSFYLVSYSTQHMFGFVDDVSPIPEELQTALGCLGQLTQIRTTEEELSFINSLPVAAAALNDKMEIQVSNEKFKTFFEGELAAHSQAEAIEALERFLSKNEMTPRWEAFAVSGRDKREKLHLQQAITCLHTHNNTYSVWCIRDETPLRAELELHRAWLETMSTPAALVQPGGQVLQCSSRFEQICGVGVGGNIGEVPTMPPESQQRTAELLSVTQSGAGSIHVEVGGEHFSLDLRHSGGLEHLLLAELTPMHSGQTPQETLLEGVVLDDLTPTFVIEEEDTAIRFVNEAAASLFFSRGAASLLGRNLRHLMQQSNVELMTPSSAHLRIDWNKISLPHREKILLRTPGVEPRRYELQVSALPQSQKSGRPLRLISLQRTESGGNNLAGHDSLTGLRSRSGLLARLGRGGVAATGGVLAVIELRSYGTLANLTESTQLHHLIMQIAAKVKLVCNREGGEAGRLEAGRFVLWLPGSGTESARALIQQITGGSYALGKMQSRMQFSTGLALLEPGAHNDAFKAAQEAISNAEVAVDWANRENGENSLVLYHEGLRAQLAETFRLEQALHEAVKDGKLQLAYQPIFSATQKTPIGAEALLRWQRDTEDGLPPEKLLNWALRLDLLGPIGEWVMREAIAQQSHWRHHAPSFRLGINISTTQLGREETLESWLRLLSEFEGQNLPMPALEISAREALKLDKDAVEILRQLEARGAELWLDAVGEQLPLEVLDALPWRGLKLHPKLTENANTPEGQRLIRGIVVLAKTLQLKVGTVGLAAAENASEAQILQQAAKLGIDQVQGLRLVGPMAAGEMGHWLKQRVKR